LRFCVIQKIRIADVRLRRQLSHSQIDGQLTSGRYPKRLCRASLKS
jgi:hypothetical protein